MPRPQFSLKTLLWLMLVVAAFFAGAAWRESFWMHYWYSWDSSDGQTGPQEFGEALPGWSPRAAPRSGTQE